MTTDILTDAGEEHLMKLGLDSVTLTVGLYNDATDNVQETDTDAGTAITTEPSNTAYTTGAPYTSAFSASDISGNWGVDNDSAFSFDFSDQTGSETVDAMYITANFNSSEGGGTGDYIIATAALSQSRDIGSVDSIDVAIGDLQITVN